MATRRSTKPGVPAWLYGSQTCRERLACQSLILPCLLAKLYLEENQKAAYLPTHAPPSPHRLQESGPVATVSGGSKSPATSASSLTWHLMSTYCVPRPRLVCDGWWLAKILFPFSRSFQVAIRLDRRGSGRWYLGAEGLFTLSRDHLGEGATSLYYHHHKKTLLSMSFSWAEAFVFSFTYQLPARYQMPLWVLGRQPSVRSRLGSWEVYSMVRNQWKWKWYYMIRCVRVNTQGRPSGKADI